MSLLVYAYTREPSTGAIIELDQQPAPPHNDLAGFEAWRHQVWGAAAVKALGLRLLPTLATGDIYAEDDELDQLAAELDVLEANLAQVASRAQVDEASLRFRVGNVREAVRLARQVAGGKGGVSIG